MWLGCQLSDSNDSSALVHHHLGNDVTQSFTWTAKCAWFHLITGSCVSCQEKPHFNFLSTKKSSIKHRSAYQDDLLSSFGCAKQSLKYQSPNSRQTLYRFKCLFTTAVGICLISLLRLPLQGLTFHGDPSWSSFLFNFVPGKVQSLIRIIPCKSPFLEGKGERWYYSDLSVL